MKISKIEIKRYRSIQDISFKIDQSFNFISFCGENNAGKTNVLRAIHLFFFPDSYNPEHDIPIHKQASWGGKVYPEITLYFEAKEKRYKITRVFEFENISLTGEVINLQTSTPSTLDVKAIEKILKNFVVKFVEVINLSIPELIEDVIEEVYDIEYEKSQFRGAKQKLRKAFDDYTSGILKILKQLGKDISPDFVKFNEDWGVDFSINTDIKKFRDLISDDIEFYIKDKSNKIVSSKGAGLQRIAFLLLQIRILSKLKSNNIPILLIDEPEAFLHPGLQKQLKTHLDSLGRNGVQVFLTTHSPVFIDTFHLRNQFLLSLEIEENVFYKRIKKHVNKVRTYSMDLETLEGSRRIKEQLGLSEPSILPIEKYNLIVEGESDKIYIENLMSFFELKFPNIVPAHGVGNIEKTLQIYRSFFRNEKKDPSEKPNILILLDNDTAGRDIYKRLKSNIGKFEEFTIKIIFCPDVYGQLPNVEKIDSEKNNWEIEDLVFPEILMKNVNVLLTKTNYNPIDPSTVLKKIDKPAFKGRGILALIDDAKNDANPDSGQHICFSNSDNSSEKMKLSLAKMFSLAGDKKVIQQMVDMDKKYPKVKEFIFSLSKLDIFFK